MSITIRARHRNSKRYNNVIWCSTLLDVTLSNVGKRHACSRSIYSHACIERLRATTFTTCFETPAHVQNWLYKTQCTSSSYGHLTKISVSEPDSPSLEVKGFVNFDQRRVLRRVERTSPHPPQQRTEVRNGHIDLQWGKIIGAVIHTTVARIISQSPRRKAG